MPCLAFGRKREYRSNFAAVVCPVQQCLPLSGAAAQTPRLTVFLDLSDVPAHGLPALDLTCVIGASPPHVIPAVPLEPAPGVFMIDPPFGAPYGKGLGSIDPEEVQSGVMVFVAELGIPKPIGGEFMHAVGHVFAAENPHGQHLPRGHLGRKVRMEVLPGRFGKAIDILLLHQIVDDDGFWLHGFECFSICFSGNASLFMGSIYVQFRLLRFSRWGQPGQQQGRRFPSLSSGHTRSIRLRLVSGCLASSTQQIHSLRASGVISIQCADATLSEMRAFRRPSGILCTTPLATSFLTIA